jgi:hypothetical protein
VDVPSWKGTKGRLTAAKEGRKKALDAIFVKEERWLLDGDGGVVWCGVVYCCKDVDVEQLGRLGRLSAYHVSSSRAVKL